MSKYTKDNLARFLTYKKDLQTQERERPKWTFKY